MTSADKTIRASSPHDIIRDCVNGNITYDFSSLMKMIEIVKPEFEARTEYIYEIIRESLDESQQFITDLRKAMNEHCHNQNQQSMEELSRNCTKNINFGQALIIDKLLSTIDRYDHVMHGFYWLESYDFPKVNSIVHHTDANNATCKHVIGRGLFTVHLKILGESNNNFHCYDCSNGYSYDSCDLCDDVNQ